MFPPLVRFPLRIRRQRFLPYRRIGSLSAIPPLLLAPLVFTGLTLTLWSYKCLMMILFQSRIIYMPGIPLGARKEKISDYAPYCRGIKWREGKIAVGDGTVLATASARLDGSGVVRGRELVVVYFQGNASSTPSRLPHLSALFSSLPPSRGPTTILIPSYRGYWTSTGRPSQRGIERDLSAIFSHIRTQHGGAETDVVLWGQSIGCGIALTGLAAHPLQNVSVLILETPFVSIKDMLVALYPQKWLPYRYLGFALWNRWKLVQALEIVLERGWKGRMLVVEAGKDELVPSGQAARIAEVAKKAGVHVEEESVKGALHVECLAKPKGRKMVGEFLARFVQGDGGL